MAAKERALAALEEQLRALRLEHDAAATECAQLSAKLAEQSTAAEAEAASLRAQLTEVTTRRRHSSGGAPAATAMLEDVGDLEAQLAAAEQGLELAAAEKEQLLEAYEALEEEVGGRIDSALAAQAARSAEVLAQSEVRSRAAPSACRIYVRHAHRGIVRAHWSPKFRPPMSSLPAVPASRSCLTVATGP